MKKKLLKWIAIGSVSLLIIVIVGGLFVGNYFYDLAINTKKDRKQLTAQALNTPTIFTPEEKELAYREAIKAEGYREWMKDTGYTEEYITSFDGLRLHGYVIKNNEAGNKWVIICHGYNSQARDMVAQAKYLYEMGFNVLMPDARGLGESEGDYTGMGWDDRHDVTYWAQALVAKQPNADIALYGLSMGGATVMMASGEADLPENVRAVVEDSGYSSIDAEFDYQLRSLFGLPPFPIMDFAALVTYSRAGYWLSAGDVVAQVKKATRPMLFIHGEADHFVPLEMLHEVHDAAPVPKEKLIVKGAGHGASYEIASDLYWGTIKNFLFKYMAG